MKKIILGVVALVGIFSASSTFACSCMMPESPTKSMQKASKVFVGTVKEVSEQHGPSSKFPENTKISLEVTKNFKNTPESKLAVYTAPNSAMCGFNFEKGKKYIVYSHKDNKNKEQVSLCSRTALASQATKDLQELSPKTYSTQEAFEKAEGKTCESATDGCNTFFVNNGKVGGGTLMYCEDTYGKKGQEKWSCIKKKEDEKICTMEYEPVCGVNGETYSNSCVAGDAKIAYKGECNTEKLSENDANLLKHLEKTLDKKLKSKVDNALVKYEKRLAKIKDKKSVNDKIIEKVEKIISDLIMKYPQDIALPKKASDLYDTLEYLKLSLMNIDFDEKNAVKIANPASTFCIENGGTLEIKDEKNGQVGYCKFTSGVSIEEWKYFRENSQKKEECLNSKNNSWVPQGMAQIPSCLTKYSDGGKTCSSSSECEGNCVKIYSDTPATCESSSSVFGCKTTIEKFNAGEGILCVD